MPLATTISNLNDISDSASGAVIDVDAAIEELVGRIDQHLSSIPTDRSLVTVDEHTDMLLDIRLMATAVRR